MYKFKRNFHIQIEIKNKIQINLSRYTINTGYIIEMVLQNVNEKL